MQPERRRESSERTGVTRARMYLKSDVDWLEGFPVAQGPGFVEWQPRPKLGEELPQKLRVDRERLTRTQFTLTKLVNRFPKAMPKLVGDVEAWRQRVTSVLDALKEAIHEGRELPRASGFVTLDRRLATHPLLAAVANRVTWSFAITPARRDEWLTWLVQNADWLSRFLELTGLEQGVLDVFLIGELALENGDDWHWLPAILGDPRCFTVPIRQFDTHIDGLMTWLRKWRDANNPPAFPERPAPTFAAQVIEFVRTIAAQNSTIRRRAARLAACFLDVRLIDEWHSVWSRLDHECSAAIRGLRQQAQYLSKWEFGFQKEMLVAALQPLRDINPPVLPLKRLLKEICFVSGEASQRLLLALTIAFDALPHPEDAVIDWNAWNLRGATLVDVVRQLQERGPEARGIRFLELQTDFFRQHQRDPWRFAPWQTAMKNWGSEKNYRCSLWRDLESEGLPVNRWDDFFQVLKRVAALPEYSDEHHESLIALFEAALDVTVVYRRYLEALQTGQFASFGTCELVSASTLEVEPKTFGTLCERFQAMNSDEWRMSDRVASLHYCLRDAGWPMLVPHMLCRDEVSPLTTTATRRSLLRDLKMNCDPIAKPLNPPAPDWAEGLPASLRDAVSLLAAVSPNAAAQADEILENAFPRRDKLDREIAAIEQRLDSSSERKHLEKRLTNLRQRRHSPAPVSDETVQRLGQKLLEVTERAVLNSFRQSIEANLAATYCARAGFQQIAEQLATPRHLELVSGIIQLPEPFRKFGLRLLRRRWGNQPWDSDAEPANQRFLKRMRNRGLNVDPWLTPFPPRTVTHPSGRAITIGFEDDDVECLLMGYYFQTCLSPDGFNFFSAVTNTVDVNKRVLFARDEQHNVVGRCLLVLGNGGAILTFHPYCHDSEFPFRQHVAEIALELAAAMRTVVSPHDQVPSLLTPRWYDDGACDLGLSLTSEGSSLRTALQSVTEENLASVLEATLAPQGWTETTLALVLELPELSQRPLLITTLLPLLDQLESRLLPATLLRAAELANQAQLHDFAARVIGRHAPDWLVRSYRQHRQFYGLAERTIDLLVFYHPSTALRVLRQTRQRTVRDDQMETDRHRCKLLAAAHRALGRENFAKSILRKYDTPINS